MRVQERRKLAAHQGPRPDDVRPRETRCGCRGGWCSFPEHWDLHAVRDYLRLHRRMNRRRYR